MIQRLLAENGRAVGDMRTVTVEGTGVGVAGNGVVGGQRLYQLVRQAGAIRDRTFEIKFLDPGVQAFSFTFG